MAPSDLPERTPRSDRRRNDARILQAAAQTLARDPAAPMAQIAAEAGVDRRTIYRRYPSRDALVEAMRRQVAGELLGALDGFEGWEQPAPLGDLLARLVGVVHRYPVATRGHDPAAAVSPVDARIVALLQDGQAAGVLRPDADPRVVNGMVFGTVAGALAAGPGDPPEAITARVTALLEAGVVAQRGA